MNPTFKFLLAASAAALLAACGGGGGGGTETSTQDNSSNNNNPSAPSTSATTMSAQDMDAALTADFNELYTAYGIKHGKVPTLDSKPPEVAAPALATLNATKAAERAKQEAIDAEARRKAEAEQAALNNQRGEQYRAMCEAARPNFPAGYPPGHTCHGIALSGTPAGAATSLSASLAVAPATAEAAPAAAAPATAKEAAKQEAGKALRGLFSR